jgi:hypothetical protein
VVGVNGELPSTIAVTSIHESTSVTIRFAETVIAGFQHFQIGVVLNLERHRHAGHIAGDVLVLDGGGAFRLC